MCNTEFAVFARHRDFLDISRHRAFLEARDELCLGFLARRLVMKTGDEFFGELEFDVARIAAFIDRSFQGFYV
jgi:hypothetical protein